MIPKCLKLRITYSKKERDFVIHYPRKADGSLIQSAILGKSNYMFLMHTSVNEADKRDERMKLVDNSGYNANIGIYQWDWLKELGQRGYDLSTFKLEITLDLSKLATPAFAHLWDSMTPREQAHLAELGIFPPKK